MITALISWSGTDLMPAYYVMAAALVGVIAVACMKETAQKPLAGSPPSVETHGRRQNWPRPRRRTRGSAPGTPPLSGMACTASTSIEAVQAIPHLVGYRT